MGRTSIEEKMAIQTFQTLYEYAARHWGKANATGGDLAIVKDLVNEAYTQALQKHPWRFMYQSATINFTVNKNAYSLPANFERIVSDEMPYIEVQTYKCLRRREINTIRRWRVENESTSQPQVFDVIPLDYSEETGSAWKLEVYPTPDASYSAILYYRINPGALEDDNHLIIGHQAFHNLVKQMIRAEIELEEDEVIGPQNAKVEALLADAIDADNAGEPDTLGSYFSPGDLNLYRRGDYTYYNTFGS